MQSTTTQWHTDSLVKRACEPVTEVLKHAQLDSCTHFPDAIQLNQCLMRYHKGNWSGPRVRAQSTFSADETRYYETIIAQDNELPTRENNWHDLFNALVWMQFPHTKALLNQLHMREINAFGVHPRTPVRDRVTHFDECGVVLAIPRDRIENGETVLRLLDGHQWETAFVTLRDYWFTDVFPFVFGHANLEMMLDPFIGLTGKWMAVVVTPEFARLSHQQRTEHVDEALYNRIKMSACFERKNWLKPLPLLGVPGWFEHQCETFYQNTDYFRPKRKGAVTTEQLPLSD